MKHIDLLSGEDIAINGNVYRPMSGGMSFDGGDGPNLTVTYQFIKTLDLKPSALPSSHPAGKRGRLCQAEDRLDRIENILREGL